jgi:hypothetical protein
MALFRSITVAEWVYVRDDMSKGLKIIANECVSCYRFRLFLESSTL